MQTTFERAHQDHILGTLTTVDRLIIRGHLMAFWYDRAFRNFLHRQGVRMVDFGGYVRQATEAVKTHAQTLAQRTGRPWIHLSKTVRGKDDMARDIARKDGLTEGLICVFSAMELAYCFAFVGGAIVPRQRKCLHFYFYILDPELGFMHVRIQSWFPFQIQIYLNGRECLARHLERHGVGHERYENTLLRIDDMDVARRFCQTFTRRKWWRVFNRFAREVNPLLPLLKRHGVGDYYWAIDACEVATDIMWKDRKGLLDILSDLFDHAMRAFTSDDVVRFLGQKLLPYKAEITSKHSRQRRPDGRRIKHRLRHNWIKMYDKWSVLRIETVINNPADFKILRFETDRRGRRRGRWMRMGKGVKNLWRYVQVGEAANRRYLEALSQVQPTGKAVRELDSLCHSRLVHGRRFGRLNPVAPSDCQVFRAVMAGEQTIGGFRNRDLQARLFPTPPESPQDAQRRCARTSRLIAKLRAHGLLAKVPHRRRYRVTSRGLRAMAAALRFRHVEFPHAMAA
jgi:hypothetical protein